MVHTESTIKSSEKICVPWALRCLARIVSLACSGLLCVDEVVGVVAQCLANDEGAFPRGRELVLVGCSLDQPEHKVSLLEGSWLDLPTVVAAQTLLVDGGSAECQQLALFQQIDAVFSHLFRLRLRTQIINILNRTEQM